VRHRDNITSPYLTLLDLTIQLLLDCFLLAIYRLKFCIHFSFSSSSCIVLQAVSRITIQMKPLASPDTSLPIHNTASWLTLLPCRCWLSCHPLHCVDTLSGVDVSEANTSSNLTLSLKMEAACSSETRGTLPTSAQRRNSTSICHVVWGAGLHQFSS
jgi:hypothetical protein